MQKSTIIPLRLVDCSKYNSLVLKAYDKAIAEWGAEYKLAAKSSNLTPGEEKNVKGAWATLKRGLGLKEGTKTCELVEIEVTIDGMAKTYYDAFELDLLRELDKAILSSSGKKPEKVTHSQKIGLSEEIAKMQAAYLIVDRNYLIYLLILRIVAVALSNEFLEVDAVNEKLEIQGFIKLLKNFINNLISNPDIFVVSNLVVEDYVSTFGIFLGRKFTKKWLIPLSALIEHNKFMTAPKLLLSKVNLALDVVEISLRSYQAIMISEIYYILSSEEWFGRTKLIKSSEQLYPVSANKTLFDFLDILKQKIDDYKLPGEAEQKDIAPSGPKLNLMENHEQRLKEEKNIKEIIIVKLKKILANYKGQDNKLKNNLQRYIDELRSLFELHEKLILIKEAVKKFIDITKAGGWFPILLGLVQPKVLDNALQNFVAFCEPVEERFEDLIDNISDPIVRRGMIRVRAMELDNLEGQAKNLGILQARKAHDKVKRLLGFDAIALVNLQHHFRRHGLLGKDEQFVAATEVPCSDLGGSVRALISYSAISSKAKEGSQQDLMLSNAQIGVANPTPK